MKTTGIITENIDEFSAKVKIKRSGMCGHDCSACGGCAAANSEIEVTAANEICARTGQTVTVESGSRLIVALSFLTYLAPVVIMIAFYCIFDGISENAGMTAAFVSFILSFAGLYLLNRTLKNKKEQIFRIIEVCKK